MYPQTDYYKFNRNKKSIYFMDGNNNNFNSAFSDEDYDLLLTKIDADVPFFDGETYTIKGNMIKIDFDPNEEVRVILSDKSFKFTSQDLFNELIKSKYVLNGKIINPNIIITPTKEYKREYITKYIRVDYGKLYMPFMPYNSTKYGRYYVLDDNEQPLKTDIKITATKRYIRKLTPSPFGSRYGFNKDELAIDGVKYEKYLYYTCTKDFTIKNFIGSLEIKDEGGKYECIDENALMFSLDWDVKDIKKR